MYKRLLGIQPPKADAGDAPVTISELNVPVRPRKRVLYGRPADAVEVIAESGAELVVSHMLCLRAHLLRREVETFFLRVPVAQLAGHPGRISTRHLGKQCVRHR